VCFSHSILVRRKDETEISLVGAWNFCGRLFDGDARLGRYHHEAAEKAAEAVDEKMAEAAGPIDINTADAAALQPLPGIGKTKAEAIIAHREANGPFAIGDDLKNVKGVGEKTLEKLKEQITVGSSE